MLRPIQPSCAVLALLALCGAVLSALLPSIAKADQPGTLSLSLPTPIENRALTATLSDPDGSISDEVWRWSWATSRTGTFTNITNANSTSYSPLAGDVSRYLKAHVTYTDADGSGKTAEAVAINPVQEAVTNAAPEFLVESVTYDVSEHAPTNHLLGKLLAVDADGDALTYTITKRPGSIALHFLYYLAHFHWDSSTGELRVKKSLDYEFWPTFEVSLEVRDSSDLDGNPSEAVDARLDITINLQNEEEQGWVDLTSYSPRLQSYVEAALSDPDGDIRNLTWQWSRATSRNGTYVNITGTNSSLYDIRRDDVGYYLKATASYDDEHGGGKSAERTTTTPVPPPPPPPPPGGGGGGGGGVSRDDHGNTAAQATRVALEAARSASTRGQLNPASDVDYFTVAVPQAGVLGVETTGPTATVGTVWQAGEELAMADSGGAGRNFRLSVRVEAGVVVIAVAGNGRQTGRYILRVTLLPGYLENPGAASFQSGIGVISGWTCDAEEVEIALNGERQPAAYGTERLDTESECGDTDNGFGLLFNWNLLGDGEHEVVASVDGVELGRAMVTVTTLGEEFLRGVEGACETEDFPSPGETVRLAWQQTQQNFVIVDGPAPSGADRAGAIDVGYLENPGPNSFQSGIGVISGWVCEGAVVEIALNGERQPTAYGTERLDTRDACGDTDNGFGLLFNWNLLGDGEHEVVAYVDAVELGRATVRVTTLGHEFLRGAEGECTVEDFPAMGQAVTLEWQQTSQNFVITDVE